MSGDGDLERPFHVEVRDEGPLAIVSPSGELDLATSDEWRDAVSTALSRNKSLVINLTGLAFMDSSGLAVLIETWKAQQERGAGLVLANPVPLVRSVLEITQLDQVIPIFETEADAVANAVSALSEIPGQGD